MSVVEAMLRGMASIRSYARKDGTTTWRVLWRDPVTKRQRSETFPTERDATTYRQLLDANGQSLTLAVETLRRVNSTKPTVAKMIERHIDSLTRPTDGTVAGYRALARDHLLGQLGAVLVEDVTADHIVEWVQWERGRGKSAKTIHNAKGLLSSAFKTAIRRGWRTDNPCDQVELQRDQRGGRRATFLTRAEFDLLLEHVPEYYQPLTRFLVESGLRYSEASALNVSDLDMSGSVPIVHVTKAWTRDDHRRDVIGPPKNDQSVRDVSIRSELAEELVAVERRSQWLFENKWAGPLRNTNFHQAAWQQAVKAAQAAGLGKCPRPHDLRHTHASWLIQAGVPLYVVSRRLGHADIRTTTRIYGHLMPQAQQDAVDALERIMGA